MPLFDGVNKVLKSTPDRQLRTNTKLVHTGTESPGDKWLADPRLPKQFQYHFGGPGWVTIPKGKIVATVPDRQFKEFESGKYYTGLTIANGGVDVEELDQERVDMGEAGATYTRVANKPVGVAHMNIYQKIDDQMYGNIPGFIRTNQYIELPYIPAEEDAKEMKWGHATGELKPGDFVKPGSNGEFVKWTPESYSLVMTGGEPSLAKTGDSIEQRVGQVLAIETNMPPEGWLQMLMWDEKSIYNTRPWLGAGTDDMRSGLGPKDIEKHGMYPYDPSYRDGFPFNAPFGTPYSFTGIPGLTDGSNIVTEFTEEIGEVPPGLESGVEYYLRVRRRPIVNDGSLS